MGRELTGFFREAVERGFVYQFSTGEWLKFNDLFNNPIVGYVGFDCTADSLHVGNLASLMLLRLFRHYGHRPVVLLGTATSRVGDPSGKDEQRVMMSRDDINRNAVGIAHTARRILPGVEIHDNAEWLNEYGLGIIEFLVEIGQHFNVNRMLSQDSVKNRLANGLTYLEFSYMVLQAYDFVQLNSLENCVLQMGGSDQWGNIVQGIELGRKMRGVELFGLTTPLIETAAGTKMGKTVEGAVWLNPDRLPVYDYWQFWRNTADADVDRFLRLFTELPLSEIDRLKALKGPELNEAKKILATEATSICHGEQAAQSAAKAAEAVFVHGGSDGLTVTDFVIPPYGDTRYADLFVAAGLVKSVGEARRLAHDGGARVDDESISETQMISKFSPHSLSHYEYKLTAGKKRHAVVHIKSFHVR